MCTLHNIIYTWSHLAYHYAVHNAEWSNKGESQRTQERGGEKNSPERYKVYAQ